MEHAHKGKTPAVKESPPSKKVEKPPVADKKPKAKETDNDLDANFTTKTEESSSEMSGSRSLVASAPSLSHFQPISVLMVLVPIALGIVWLVLMAIFAVVICCRRRR